jgi:hypothetical protein
MSEAPHRELPGTTAPRIPVMGILPALLVSAVILDAVHPLGRGVLASLWLDLAALACAACALASPRSRQGRGAWATSFDGRILAALAIAVLQAVPSPANAEGLAWLQQMLACGAFFYALTLLLRGREGVGEVLWAVFGVGCVVFGLHALMAATNGLGALRAEADKVDAAWDAHHGLAKAMAFLTLLSTGRAFESASSARWRVTALIGGVGCLLHAAAGGFGLDPHSLGRLDEPLYFSATAVLLLMLFGLVRRAWEQRRARPHEARRWRAMAAGFVLLAVFGLFGETTGGEGVRVLAVLAAVTVLAVEPVAAAGAAQRSPEGEAEEPLRQAA